MSSDIIHIEVDKKFIHKFFELAGNPVPKDFSVNEFNNALSKIGRKISLSKEQAAQIDSESGEELKNEEKLKILMIDNVGFIMQRVKQQLSRQEYTIEIFNDVSKAIDKIKREPFDFIILNILIPTEREGTMFLKEVKAILADRKVKPKIIITGDAIKKELLIYLKENGIRHILERRLDWITKLLELIEQEKEFLV